MPLQPIDVKNYENDVEEKQAALELSLTEPIFVARGTHLNFTPKYGVRIITEGQYQAMLSVWLETGHSIFSAKEAQDFIP